jgi:hypothetical protein
MGKHTELNRKRINESGASASVRCEWCDKCWDVDRVREYFKKGEWICRYCIERREKRITDLSIVEKLKEIEALENKKFDSELVKKYKIVLLAEIKEFMEKRVEEFEEENKTINKSMEKESEKEKE